MKRGMVAICLLSNLALLQAGELEIGEKWKTTPEYVEYSKLDPNSQIAKKLKEDTITRLTNESLKIYLDSFDVKFKSLMEKRVEELPIGLKGLLCNINIKIKEKLTKNYDSMSISKINNHMFNFVDSIYKDKGTAEKNISELPKIAPELANTEIMNILLDTGRKYDSIVKSEENIKKSEENIDNWNKIIEKLQKM
jgi:hypothetical protein